ncbi:MAG TPA: TolC family protein [Candidatus Krumholzibacteria bacterium]|nr:TolC family protein [Candidatus Krumholzibacteria bacterium]
MDRSQSIARCGALAILLGSVLLGGVRVDDVRAATLIDESQFLRVFDAGHPAVIALGDRMADAEATRMGAGTLANPVVDAEVEAPDGAADQATFRLGWKPPLDGRRSAAIDAADAAVEAARHDLAWRRVQLRRRMRAVFADWAVAHARSTALREHVDQLRALEQRARLRAERGEDSPLAARRLSLEVGQAVVDLADAEAERAHQRGRAASAHGALPTDAVPRLPDLPEGAGISSDFTRADVRARRSEVDAAEATARRAGRVLEFPELGFGWTRIAEAGDDFSGPVFGATWEIPLFDRDQDTRTRTRRERALAEARLVRSERRARAERQVAVETYRTLAETADEVGVALDDASGVIDAARASFLAGESSTTDLLDALRSVIASRLAALDLHALALAAHRELELNTRSETAGGSGE